MLSFSHQKLLVLCLVMFLFCFVCFSSFNKAQKYFLTCVVEVTTRHNKSHTSTDCSLVQK